MTQTNSRGGSSIFFKERTKPSLSTMISIRRASALRDSDSRLNFQEFQSHEPGRTLLPTNPARRETLLPAEGRPSQVLLFGIRAPANRGAKLWLGGGHDGSVAGGTCAALMSDQQMINENVNPSVPLTT